MRRDRIYQQQIRQERQHEERGVKYYVNGQLLSRYKISPGPARVVSIVDKHELNCSRLGDHVNRLDRKEERDVREKEEG